MNDRRQFIKSLGLTMGAAALSLPSLPEIGLQRIRFGILADPHKDLVPDADQRLEKFMAKAMEGDCDFILQLGDFCFPQKKNADFLRIWNQYQGPKHHVLGNHDMDVSSKQETIDFWGMEAPFYAFSARGYRFIILDANFIYRDGQYFDYEKANFYIDDIYRTYVHPDQIDWLKDQLEQHPEPTFVFSHQSLLNYKMGVKNRMKIQQVMEDANQKAGFQQVIACFNGHDHIDFHHRLNGIHYIEVNSMSYQWLGDQYENTTRFPAAWYKQYPSLGKFAPYEDALFAFVEVDPVQGKLNITGIQSEWMAPSPAELGVPPQMYGSEYSPLISNRNLTL